MNKLSKEKRNQIIAIAAGALAICAALWYFVIGDQEETLRKINESTETLQTKIDKAQRLVKRRASIETDLAGLRQQIALAEAQMIPIEQLSGKKWMADRLSNFIKGRYDVTLLNLSNDALTGKQYLLLPKFDYSAAAYTVEVRAFYHEFGKFLADFENSFPYMRIQSLQIWPLATPLAATGAAADTPEELLNSDAREQLHISMKVVVLFKPAGNP